MTALPRNGVKEPKQIPFHGAYERRGRFLTTYVGLNHSADSERYQRATPTMIASVCGRLGNALETPCRCLELHKSPRVLATRLAIALAFFFLLSPFIPRPSLDRKEDAANPRCRGIRSAPCQQTRENVGGRMKCMQTTTARDLREAQFKREREREK
ncbi:hypothetical protein EYF80_041630 [Liparis tanakae]|uniref:Uncharacterized protein n=1 Tax=Liparis tanakae TaxID=230148 RepID=A0A4Z2G4U5_9TELE|nr:hypothetical protein EYF80_041630 [Liparis tanakae]